MQTTWVDPNLILAPHFPLLSSEVVLFKVGLTFLDVEK